MVFPARWKNPAHKTSKCGKSYHSQDAEENKCAIQANLFSPCDCVPPTAGIVYRAGFVMTSDFCPLLSGLLAPRFYLITASVARGLVQIVRDYLLVFRILPLDQTSIR